MAHFYLDENLCIVVHMTLGEKWFPSLNIKTAYLQTKMKQILKIII